MEPVLGVYYKAKHHREGQMYVKLLFSPGVDKLPTDCLHFITTWGSLIMVFEQKNDDSKAYCLVVLSMNTCVLDVTDYYLG